MPVSISSTSEEVQSLFVATAVLVVVVSISSTSEEVQRVGGVQINVVPTGFH